MYFQELTSNTTEEEGSFSDQKMVCPTENSLSDRSPTKHIWGQTKGKNNTLPLAMIQKLQEEKEKELEGKKRQAQKQPSSQ